MTLKSDFATTVTWNSLTLKCRKIGYPEIASERIAFTYHSATNGAEEYLPSGRITTSEFDIEFLVESANIDALSDAMVAKTNSSMVITDGNDIFTFSAFCTKVGKAEHDAESPSVISAVATFSPATLPAVTAPV